MLEISIALILILIVLGTVSSYEVKESWERTDLIGIGDNMLKLMRNEDILDIFYDVGTSRAWNGTITEVVEFRTYGKIPDSYTGARGWYEKNCTVSDIENGKSYIWAWENERIKVSRIYISYSTGAYRYFWGRLSPFIIFPSLIIVPIIIIKIRKRNKMKRNSFIS